jgi:hypothetical protein
MTGPKEDDMSDIYGTDSLNDWRPVEATTPKDIRKLEQFEVMLDAIARGVADRIEKKAQSDLSYAQEYASMMRGEAPKTS